MIISVDCSFFSFVRSPICFEWFFAKCHLPSLLFLFSPPLFRTMAFRVPFSSSQIFPFCPFPRCLLKQCQFFLPRAIPVPGLLFLHRGFAACLASVLAISFGLGARGSSLSTPFFFFQGSSPAFSRRWPLLGPLFRAVYRGFTPDRLLSFELTQFFFFSEDAGAAFLCCCQKSFFFSFSLSPLFRNRWPPTCEFPRGISPSCPHPSFFSSFFSNSVQGDFSPAVLSVPCDAQWRSSRPPGAKLKSLMFFLLVPRPFFFSHTRPPPPD